jgi:hypothetical protein
MKERIVAEISRNWTGTQEDDLKPLISQTFEEVIKTNAARGYTLESWKFRTLETITAADSPIAHAIVMETIIAVFVK